MFRKRCFRTKCFEKSMRPISGLHKTISFSSLFTVSTHHFHSLYSKPCKSQITNSLIISVHFMARIQFYSSLIISIYFIARVQFYSSLITSIHFIARIKSLPQAAGVICNHHPSAIPFLFIHFKAGRISSPLQASEK